MRPLIALMLLSITACATTPVTINQATAVPDTRILAPQLLAQAKNTGSLVVKRDGGFMGSACTIRVFVDAVAVADLGPSEKVEVFVPLGEHSVVVTPDNISVTHPTTQQMTDAVLAALVAPVAAGGGLAAR